MVSSPPVCMQPVLVVGVDKQLSPDMWTPQSFSRDFGASHVHTMSCDIC